MISRGWRWLSPLTLGAVFFLLSALMHPADGGQASSSTTEEQDSPPAESTDPQAPTPTQEVSEPREEAPTATEEILAPLEETPTPAPGIVAVPGMEGKKGPITYTVKKGDTLWDITYSYYKDSFLWPKVWQNNKQIFNPDLIYPGNVITLPGEEEIEAALTEAAQPMKPAKPTPSPAAEKPPTPEIEKGIEVAVQELPAPTEKPPDLSLLASSGYILTDRPAVGIVVGARDNRELIGQDETAYLRLESGLQNQVGDRYTLYRVVRKVYHPKTGRYLGDLIRILGTAEITGADPKEKTVSSRVLVSYDYIQKGDSLMPPQSPEASSETVSRSAPPEGRLTGYIVAVKEDRNSQAQHDVVYLDRGRRDGLQTGDRFAVFRAGEKTSIFSPGGGVRLPRRVIGQLQIIAIQDVTATAKVIQSTEVIYKGDYFEALSIP